MITTTHLCEDEMKSEEMEEPMPKKKRVEEEEKKERREDVNPYLCHDGFTRILNKPINEEERMKELDEMKIYGTFPVPQLDLISSLAQRLVKTELVKINLVGESDQWIVSSSSKMEESSIARDGFCAKVIATGMNLIVEDAYHDPVMKDHWFVKNKRIGAYLGVPLITPKGNAIGTICAIHPLPFSFSEEAVKNIEELAKMAVNAIFLRHRNLSDKQIVEYQKIRTRDLREDKKVLMDGLRKFPDGVFVWSLKSKSIVFANEGFERITGYSAKEIEGTSDLPLKFLLDSQSDQYKELSDWFGENATETKKEFEAVRKNGKKYWAYVQISPTKDCQDRISSFLGTLSDVTERKSSEIELAKNRDAMTLAVKAKSCFLANMSHEIKTPLHAICATAKSLVSLEGQTKDQMELGRMIQISSESLLGLVSDILDYSKIDAEQMELNSNTFDIRDALDTCLSVFHPAASNKGLNMKIDVEPNVPRRMCTDVKRLTQVISELVSNAITFTESGQVLVTVSMRNSDKEVIGKSPQLIQFAVKDTGIGVKKEAFDHLFQPFWQVDQSRTRRYGGTGLGLAISRRLAIALGGDMWAQSVFGEGSTFSFYVMDCEGSPLPSPSPSLTRSISNQFFPVPFHLQSAFAHPEVITNPSISFIPSLLPSKGHDERKKRGYSSLQTSQSCIVIQSLPSKVSKNQ